MPMVNKVVGYAGSLYAVTLLCSAISFVVTMIVAHRIPKEAFGEYGLFVTVCAVLGMFLASGLNQAVIRHVGLIPEAKRDLIGLILVSFGCIAAVAWPLAIALLAGGFGNWVFALAVL